MWILFDLEGAMVTDYVDFAERCETMLGARAEDADAATECSLKAQRYRIAAARNDLLCALIEHEEEPGPYYAERVARYLAKLTDVLADECEFALTGAARVPTK